MSIHPYAAEARPVNPFVSRGLPGLANRNEAYISTRLLDVNNTFADDYVLNGLRGKTGTIQRLADWTMFGEPGQEAAINRRPGDTFAQSEGYGLDPMTFSARTFAKEAKTPREALTDEQLGTPQEFDAKEIHLAKVMRDLVIEVEKYTAPVFQTAANFSSTKVVPIKWDQATSDPIADLIALGDLINEKGGFFTDLVMPRTPTLALRTNKSLRDYAATDKDNHSFNTDRLRALFLENLPGLERVWFPTGKMRTNMDPKATLALADTWTPTVFMGGLTDQGGIPVGGPFANEIMLHPTAVTRVDVEPWNTESRYEQGWRSYMDQIQYRQWTGVVNKGCGGTLTAPL